MILSDASSVLLAPKASKQKSQERKLAPQTEIELTSTFSLDELVTDGAIRVESAMESITRDQRQRSSL